MRGFVYNIFLDISDKIKIWTIDSRTFLERRNGYFYCKFRFHVYFKGHKNKNCWNLQNNTYLNILTGDKLIARTRLTHIIYNDLIEIPTDESKFYCFLWLTHIKNYSLFHIPTNMLEIFCKLYIFDVRIIMRDFIIHLSWKFVLGMFLSFQREPSPCW